MLTREEFQRNRGFISLFRKRATLVQAKALPKDTPEVVLAFSLYMKLHARTFYTNVIQI